MADIFLSYKREDRNKVFPLVEALQGQGWSVWWDNRIGAGETWDQVIEAELKAARCVLVVWSKRSIESDWVRAEAHEGRERRCLIPVILEGVAPPSIFRMIQATDLSNWDGESKDPNFAHVCAGIARLLVQREPAFSGVETTTEVRPKESDPKKNDSMSSDAPQLGQHRRRGRGRLIVAAVASTVLLIGVSAVSLIMLPSEKSQRHHPDASPKKATGVEPPPLSPENKSGTQLQPPPSVDSPPIPKQSENDLVIETQTKVIENDPRNYAAHLSRGVAYSNKYELDKAMNDLTKAVTINSKGAEAFFHRGYVYRRKGDNKRAVADYTKALSINPKYAEAYSYRGYANYSEEEYDAAIADFNKALEFNTAYADAFAGRALAHHGKLNYEPAIRDYTKAIELDPKNAKYFNGRGVIQHDRAHMRTKNPSDYAKAIADYSKAVELDPNYAIAYKNRGFTHRVTSDLERAIQDYTRSIEINPRLAEAYNGRGYAYQVRGRPDDRSLAEADYIKAVEVDPKLEVAKRNLKELREKK